jgi:hypothetical protein
MSCTPFHEQVQHNPAYPHPDPEVAFSEVVDLDWFCKPLEAGLALFRVNRHWRILYFPDGGSEMQSFADTTFESWLPSGICPAVSDLPVNHSDRVGLPADQIIRKNPVLPQNQEMGSASGNF